MSNSITVQASMSLQNITKLGNCNLRSLLSQCDQLNMKRNKIEKNEALPQKQKDNQLAQIDNELNELTRQLEEARKKEDKKIKQKQMEEEKERLMNTMDPETAEMVLKMNHLMTMAASSEPDQMDNSEYNLNVPEDSLNLQEDNLAEDLIQTGSNIRSKAEPANRNAMVNDNDAYPFNGLQNDSNKSLLPNAKKGYFIDKKI